MEQFDTDDKLLENQKKEKNEVSKYLLIGVLCTIAVVACIVLFKYINSPSKTASLAGSSKNNLFNIYFLIFYR